MTCFKTFGAMVPSPSERKKKREKREIRFAGISQGERGKKKKKKRKEEVVSVDGEVVMGLLTRVEIGKGKRRKTS